MIEKTPEQSQKSEMESDATWPPFLGDLLKAELTAEGLEGRLLHCDRWLVMFMHAEREVVVPRHHHGAQWGVVLDGEMELSINDQQHVYRRGDSHFIPEGVEHEAILRAGWKGLYVFARHP